MASISPHGPPPMMITAQSCASLTSFPGSMIQRYTSDGDDLRNVIMNPTVAVVAQGAMGAGVGARLVERGLRVVTSLAGRSEDSAKRAKAAGMVAVSDQELARADYFLSILPPSDALALAEKMAALIGPSNHKPIYVDCNAVSPPTKIEIGHVIARRVRRSSMPASSAARRRRAMTGRESMRPVPMPDGSARSPSSASWST